MEDSAINLKQERDFGEVFNATFSFIKQEFKNLGLSILYFVLPFLLIASILMVFIGLEQQKLMQGFSTSIYSYEYGNPFSNLGRIFLYYGMTIILYAISATAIKCTILGYIKLYNQKGSNGFSVNDVWNQVKKYFFPVLGTSILVGIIVVIGFVFCLIPGIYLGVSLCLIYAALVFEDGGFSNAFSRSFEITKSNWWLTLGLIVVIYLIVYIITIVLSIPSMVIGLAPMISNLSNLEEASSFAIPTGYFIMTAFINLITYILMGIPVLMLAIHYFSLVESTEKPTLSDKIEQIGSDLEEPKL